MHARPSSGFILPLALVLSTGLMLMAMLAWEWEANSLPRHEASLLHERARNTLLLNLAGCLEHLQEDILTARAASALVSGSVEEPDVLQAIRLDPDSGEIKPLHSAGEGATGSPVSFKSPLSASRFSADFLPLATGGSSIKQALAWAAEDIQLMAPETPPPEFWPLPSWDLAPGSENGSVDAFLDEWTNGIWQSLQWIPAGDPIPFMEDHSPACVPVVRNLGIRFGIFAAGRSTRHEKTIRVRFFIEGELWNPYNRVLQLHPGRGMRSVMRVIFWNLPEIRLHNRTMGISSSWISLDQARNSRSGSTGLHGYIRLPGTLDSGKSVTFTEPDPSRQPQGLARTLHSGFPVRPADRVEIEIRQPPGGLHVACLPINAEAPLDKALSGKGWFRAEAYPASWPQLVFERADAGPKPFLLENGSLSFRIDNTHVQASFENRVSTFPYNKDPRIKRVISGESHQNPNGSWGTGADLFALNVERLSEPFFRISPQQPFALFSWPAKAPDSLIEAMDLPQWANGFRLGTVGADLLNAHFNTEGMPISSAASSERIELVPVHGSPVDFRPSFPVNQVSESAWMHRFQESSSASSTGRLSFPAFVNPHPDNESHFRTWSERELEHAARECVASIRTAPFPSPAAFFNSGILGASIQERPDPDPLHPFMPLRGWLRNTPMPRSHGAAWILHMASQAVWDSQEALVTARIWLLESRSSDGTPQFEIIRFEWTDPKRHLRLSSRQRSAQVVNHRQVQETLLRFQ